MTSLKFDGCAVVLQEVPTEVSLAFNITGCPHRCPGCHSPHLWEDVGKDLLSELDRYLDNYEDLITCVCFMGGEHHPEEMLLALQRVRWRGLKTCLYSGADSAEGFASLLPWLDYLKIGHYDSELGGLDNPNTNQHMFRMVDGGRGYDITSSFWKNKRSLS